MYSQRATPKSMSFPAKQKLHQTLIFLLLDTFQVWHTHSISLALLLLVLCVHSETQVLLDSTLCVHSCM